jgi:hypothetical protein
VVGAAGEVVRLVGVEEQVVELLARARRLGQAVLEQQVLARAVVDVREHRQVAVAPPPHVLVPARADRALRVVRRVIRQLGEHRVVDLARVAAHRGHERAPLHVLGHLDPDQLAERREDVDLRDQRVVDPAAVEPARAAQDQRHAHPAVRQGRLAAREGDPVVGGEDHDRVVGHALLVERAEHRADPVVEPAGGLLEGRHVAPRHGRVRQVPGRQGVQRVAHGGRLEVVAVGLEEADGEEERLRRALAQDRHGGRRDVVGPRRVGVGDEVVAEILGVLGDVLLADHRREVARVAQRVEDVLARVVEREPAVGEPEHPVAVRPAAGHERRAAGRARGRRGEGVAEQQPLVGEPLDVRRDHLVPVRLQVAAGVVGHDEDDVRWRLGHSRPVQCTLSRVRRLLPATLLPS